MNNKISITGDLGSGKSSVCTLLQKKLDYPIVSVGTVQRKLAAEHNMTTTEFNRYVEKNPNFDKECDDRQRKEGLSDLPKIFDSRLGWYFVPHSFKVYLAVDLEVATERIFNDVQRVSETYQSKEVTKSNILERRKSEVERFKTQYGLNINDYNNFDLVINTSYHHIEEVVNVIIDCYHKFNAGEPFQSKWWL